MIGTFIEKLGDQFSKLNWDYQEKEINGKKEIISYWPGENNEDIMICVLKSDYFKEVFHRQDFFFLNFAYKNNYEALSRDSNNKIKIKENDCYIGQPFNGYALVGDNRDNNEDIIIIGILIKKPIFFKEYLPSITSESKLFEFIFENENDSFSENCIHVSCENSPVKNLFELAITEYANKGPQTESILKSLTLSILMYINKIYLEQYEQDYEVTTVERIITYIRDNIKSVSLKSVADHFSYHPNYISNLLKKETGKSFSEIRLKERMEKAQLLIDKTDLTIKEIANLTGFSDTGNFYKAFSKYFNVSPRQLN